MRTAARIYLGIDVPVVVHTAAREERDATKAQLDAANESLEAIGNQFSSMINEVHSIYLLYHFAP